MSEDIVDRVSILVAGAVITAFAAGVFVNNGDWFFAGAFGAVSLMLGVGLVLLVDKML